LISTVCGRVNQILDDGLILEVGPVGLEIHTPQPLRARISEGEEAYLFTYLAVRQDSLTLFGFESAEEKQYFELLLGVNGIGPRLALAILSSLTPDAIRRAVFHEQTEIISRVPGVGKKTAQKIVLHLQDRIKSTGETFAPVSSMHQTDMDVLNALTALGYSIIEAQTAVQSIPKDTEQDTETRLRVALQYLAK